MKTLFNIIYIIAKKTISKTIPNTEIIGLKDSELYLFARFVEDSFHVH